CGECDVCCKYVSVEIDKPITKTEIEDVKFYLYHEGTSVYIDHDNDWYILFESKCDKLNSNGLCTIYEDRPPICRNFERESCHEQDWHESHKVLFQDVKDLMGYLRKARPTFYKKHYSSYTGHRPRLRA
ncbi:MAG: YkgJ family cysteine cluster protein, partial [Candidatus Brocadiales bacterium]